MKKTGHSSSALPKSSSTVPAMVSVCEVTLRSSISSGTKTRPETQQMAPTGGSFVAPTTLEPSLLRGITTQTLLRGCAVAFRSQEFDIAQHYSKSFETQCLGGFVSHDWSSSRFHKLVALGLVYNSRAAMVASTISSFVVMLLQSGADPILPPPRFTDEVVNIVQHYGFWSSVAGPLVFLVIFLFWQDLRPWLRLRSQSCFLDKCCIDQSNDDRKRAGILGLAGFLRCSDRFIILWTPRYFTRLWCTYEVASWLYLNKPMASVCFIPLAHADIVATVWTLLVVVVVAVSVLMPLYPRYHWYILLSGTFLSSCWISDKARRCAQNLHAMKDQLMNFTVTNAECFCCTSDHVTATGEAIPCDRQVVYATIAEWFNSADDDDGCVTQEACLDRFDQAVRKRFAEQVLQKVGATQLPYRYVAVAGWPLFLRVFDIMLASYAARKPAFMVNLIILYLAFPAAIFPLCYKFALMHLCSWVDLWVGRPRSCALDLLVSAAVAAAIVIVLGFLYVPFGIVLARNWSPVVMLSMATVMFAFTCWVYPDSVEYFKEGFKECCLCKRRCCKAAPSQSMPCGGHEGNRGSVEETEEKEENAGKGENECPHKSVESDDDIASVRSI